MHSSGRLARVSGNTLRAQEPGSPGALARHMPGSPGTLACHTPGEGRCRLAALSPLCPPQAILETGGQEPCVPGPAWVLALAGLRPGTDTPSPRQTRTVGQPLYSLGSHSLAPGQELRPWRNGQSRTRCRYTNVAALGVTRAACFCRAPSHGKLGQGRPPVARMVPLCKSEKGAPPPGGFRPGQVHTDQSEGPGRILSLLAPSPGVLAHCPPSPEDLGAAVTAPGPGGAPMPSWVQTGRLGPTT